VQPTGETSEKLASHGPDTKQHLDYSCYIFNDDGKVLVTKRADSKKVWPSVWTNSVCGHPAPGESFEGAIQRHSQYENGLNVTVIDIRLPKY
jgi:isopentenyl-diphosphate delta-isomerase